MKRAFDESRLRVSGPPASSRDGERREKGVKDAATLPPLCCFDWPDVVDALIRSFAVEGRRRRGRGLGETNQLLFL